MHPPKASNTRKNKHKNKQEKEAILMNKKVVFLDLDGTLVQRNGIIPDSAKEALRRATENGHEMVICTGRSATQVDPVVKDAVELFTGIVCSAGANIRRKGEVVWRGSMSPEKTKDLVNYFRDNGFSYFLQSEDGIFAEQYGMDIINQTFRNMGVPEEKVAELFGYTTLTNHPEDYPHIEKCCYFQCPKEAVEVQADLGDYYQVVDSSYKITRFCDGEICKNGVNKATGMAKYLEAAGVPHEDCIAFGDGPNDLEMIQYAALGVCMGNGTDSLKALADRICGNIDEDGIYNEFKALGLI